MKKSNFNHLLLTGIICLGIGFLAGQVKHTSSTKAAEYTLLRTDDPAYHLSRPLVGVDITSEPEFPELTNTRKIIDSFIKEEIQSGRIIRASVYLRTLQNAHWFSINDTEKFTPGSLLKVPIMMAYFKEAENQPEALQQKVYYKDDSIKKLLPNELESGLAPNREYTIQELITAMIVNSDNKAKDILLAHIQPSYLVDVFSELGIPLDGNSTEYVGSRVYASFFRRLYNSTFLNRDHSEQALTLLGKTTYIKGLVAGVPPGTEVVHKYGERGVYAENNTLVGADLHDCGILYLKKQDILLCVMTEGKNIPDLENAIKNIASITAEKLGK